MALIVDVVYVKMQNRLTFKKMKSCFMRNFKLFNFSYKTDMKNYMRSDDTASVFTNQTIIFLRKTILVFF